MAYRRTLADNGKTYWPDQGIYDTSEYYRQWRADRHRGDLVAARQAMWDAQDGKCYLCERELGPERRAIVEHDHRCCPPNRSCDICRRGLACDLCNWLVGQVGDDPDLMVLIAGNLRAAKEAVTARLTMKAEADAAREKALADAAATYSRRTPRRQRKIVAAELRQLGCTLQEIAKVFHVTREAIRQDLLT